MASSKDGFISHLTYLVQLPYLGKSQNIKNGKFSHKQSDRWVGKWNHLSTTHRLTINCAQNYCNRTLIVQVILENVVTCFFFWDTVYFIVKWATSILWALLAFLVGRHCVNFAYWQINVFEHTVRIDKELTHFSLSTWLKIEIRSSTSRVIRASPSRRGAHEASTKTFFSFWQWLNSVEINKYTFQLSQSHVYFNINHET